MLFLRWLTSASIIAACGLLVVKITPSSGVLAKNPVLPMPSPSKLLKEINPNLIAQRQSRFALVIGNADYEEGALANPVNDATDIAQALRDLGFEVTLLQNKDLQSMEDAVENFSRQLRKDGVGVFYFAGHGIQVGGENYLIPLKAKLSREKNVRYEGLALGQVLNAMAEAESHVNIVIIDACRDNPFYRRWPSTQRGSMFVRGLTKVDSPPQGTVIAFAAASNQYAEDGSGRNSPFTSNLLRYIKEPNLDIVLMFRKVREGVLNETKKEQEPWYQESLVGGSFYFNEAAALASQPSPIPVNIPETQPSPNPVTTPQTQPSSSSQLTAKALYDSGLKKYNAGYYYDAIAEFTQSIQIDSENSDAYVYRAISKRNLNDYYGAISDYNKAIKLKSDYARAFYGRGLSKSDLGDERGALEDYDQAIKIKPDYAEVYHNRGVSKYVLGDYQGSILDENQAIKIKPDYTKAYYGRGLSKYNLGDYQGAITDYNQAIKLKLDYAEVYVDRGISKNELKNYQGAITDYNQAIKLKPDYARAYNNRGNSKKDLGDNQGAISDYNQAIKLKPDYANAYYNRGAAKYNLGDNQGAISDYNQAIKLNPNFAYVYYNGAITNTRTENTWGTSGTMLNPANPTGNTWDWGTPGTMLNPANPTGNTWDWGTPGTMLNPSNPTGNTWDWGTSGTILNPANPTRNTWDWDTPGTMLNPANPTENIWRQQNKIQDYQDAINQLKKLGISN
jgi:tetratricopeptide (TPR) repeat protein